MWSQTSLGRGSRDGRRCMVWLHHDEPAAGLSGRRWAQRCFRIPLWPPVNLFRDKVDAARDNCRLITWRILVQNQARFIDPSHRHAVHLHDDVVSAKSFGGAWLAGVIRVTIAWSECWSPYPRPQHFELHRLPYEMKLSEYVWTAMSMRAWWVGGTRLHLKWIWTLNFVTCCCCAAVHWVVL